MGRLGARIVIAGTASGVGKTTVATGLMAALRSRGLRVAGAKVGPDFIDPGYHQLATGRPGRNLDPWMSGAAALLALAGRAADGADVLVVEGAMGLFDGAFEPPPASTAEVARLIAGPVVLVVDAASVGASVAATVAGFAGFDSSVAVAGVILNRVGSDSHEFLLREALAPLGIPVLGALRRRSDIAWRSRHLGLVPVIERPADIRSGLRRLRSVIESDCDVDALLALAQQAPAIAVDPPPAPRRQTPPDRPIRVAVAAGPAFSFVYEDNLEALRQAGAEVVTFDPLVEDRLPDDVRALVAGGGFPEVYAPALASNRPLLTDVGRAVAGGLVVWAECGGMLWLSETLDTHRLASVFPCVATMGKRLTLGYRRGTFAVDNPLGPAGTPWRGHEFHYSQVEPAGDALTWVGRHGAGSGGFATRSVLASYIHLHLGAAPELAEHFVAATAASSARWDWVR